MFYIHRLLKACTALSCVITLVACSTVPESEIEYKKSRSLPSLEIPPDLISPSVVDEALVLPDAAALGSLPAKTAAGEEIRVERDGGLRWLVIKAEAPQLWQRVHSFWKDNGFEVKEADPRLGIIDTSWEENRGITSKNSTNIFFRKAFDVFYSSSTRDQFRVRLEPGITPGTTELYLSHRGMAQVIKSDSPLWQHRPADPALEAEMLKRLALFLGTGAAKAQGVKDDLTSPAPARATLANDAEGLPLLTVLEDYPSAWRRTGLALDHLGAKIEDQNRAKGSYQIRFKDPFSQNEQTKGWFSKLFSNSKEKSVYFELRLLERGKETHMMAFDQAGNRDNSPVTQRFFTLLHEQLK